jgi:hypothetical protein
MRWLEQIAGSIGKAVKICSDGNVVVLLFWGFAIDVFNRLDRVIGSMFMRVNSKVRPPGAPTIPARR